MANYRTVRVEFWDDPWVETLTPIQKLLYLYLFTCKHVNNLGVLEVSRRKVAFETGLAVQEVEDVLVFFVSEGKVVETPKYIWAVKFIKHQANTSPKLITSLGKQLEEVCDVELVKNILEEYAHLEIPYVYPIDTLSIGYQTESDTVPGKGKGKGIGKGREEGCERDAGARIYGYDEEEPPPDPGQPPQQGPKKTPYPSKSRPSYRTFKSCLDIYPGDVVEDEAWVAWCDMEDRGMLDEDMNFIRDLLIGLAQKDDRWREGFAPSFAKCIKTRAWRKKPFKRPNNGAQSPAQSGQPTQPRATTQAQANAQTRKGLAKALNAKRRERHGEGQPGQIDGGDGGSSPELPGFDDRGGRDCSLASGMDGGPRALDGEAISGGDH